MERRIKPGISYEGALDESRRSPLLTQNQGRVVEEVDLPTFRPLAGASANNRGQGRMVTLPTFAGGAAFKVPSIVQSPQADGDTDGELISVRLGMTLPDALTDITGANPYTGIPISVLCLLDFGVGSVSYTAEVDWNQGTVFGISASFVRVSALVGAIPAGFVLPDIDIVLQASLAYGDASNAGISAEARRTFNLGGAEAGGNVILAGATSALIPIPFWAVGMTLVDGGSFPALLPLAPDYTISLFENATANAKTMYKVESRTNVANQIEGQFPITAGSRFAAITNNLGVAMRAPKLIFNLSL